jgi:hypothetical protein
MVLVPREYEYMLFHLNLPEFMALFMTVTKMAGYPNELVAFLKASL